MGSGKPQIRTRQATHYGAIFWERVHKFHHVLKTLTAAEEKPWPGQRGHLQGQNKEGPNLDHQVLE